MISRELPIDYRRVFFDYGFFFWLHFYEQTSAIEVYQDHSKAPQLNLSREPVTVPRADIPDTHTTAAVVLNIVYCTILLGVSKSWTLELLAFEE